MLTKSKSTGRIILAFMAFLFILTALAGQRYEAHAAPIEDNPNPIADGVDAPLAFIFSPKEGSSHLAGIIPFGVGCAPQGGAFLVFCLGIVRDLEGIIQPMVDGKLIINTPDAYILTLAAVDNYGRDTVIYAHFTVVAEASSGGGWSSNGASAIPCFTEEGCEVLVAPEKETGKEYVTGLKFLPGIVRDDGTPAGQAIAMTIIRRMQAEALLGEGFSVERVVEAAGLEATMWVLNHE